MSSKNRVSASQAASLAAPFGVPRRKGIVSKGLVVNTKGSFFLIISEGYTEAIYTA
jgi:hypothetical protein